jgi:exopolyphosphatase/pppGpp-phosphohydrolase
MHRDYFHNALMTRYQQILSQLPDPGNITVLHLAAEQTGVASGSGIAPPVTQILALGSQRSAREFFKRTPPGRLEFELAIDPVEDEIIRVSKLLAPHSTLYSSDEVLRQIALLAGVPDSAAMLLDLDAMERCFSRLAAVIQGKPAAHEGMPSDNALAASLLILREFMHHLGFASICILR